MIQIAGLDVSYGVKGWWEEVGGLSVVAAGTPIIIVRDGRAERYVRLGDQCPFDEVTHRSSA